MAWPFGRKKREGDVSDPSQDATTDGASAPPKEHTLSVGPSGTPREHTLSVAPIGPPPKELTLSFGPPGSPAPAAQGEATQALAGKPLGAELPTTPTPGAGENDTKFTFGPPSEASAAAHISAKLKTPTPSSGGISVDVPPQPARERTPFPSQAPPIAQLGASITVGSHAPVAQPDATQNVTPRPLPPAGSVGPDPFAGPLPKGGARFGDYQLHSELGRGGMGVVYKARHLTLNRDVALKLMLSQDVPEAERVRFLREAESSAALKHPHIVAVHDVGTAQGKLFFSMDFIEGTTYRKIMQERPGDLQLLLSIFVKVCDAVGYAHRRGIIHRDLKPQNVMVDPDMNPHVMDFGLAGRVGEPEVQEQSGKKKKRITRIGAVIGTPIYMPPEQAGGRTDEIDTRSDIYSLGVILYLILAREFPFNAPSPAELYVKIESEKAPLPSKKNPDCPWELERVVLKAIEKRREDRYQTAFELKDEIEAWLAGRPVAAVHGGTIYRAQKFVARNRGSVMLTLAATIAVIATVSYFTYEAVQEARESRARSATLVVEGLADLDAARAKRGAFLDPNRAPDHREARRLLDSADQKLASAITKFVSAKQYDKLNTAAWDGESAAGKEEEALKRLIDQEVEAKTKDEYRDSAQRKASVAEIRLQKVDPRVPKTPAEIAEAKKTIEDARDNFVSAIALDYEAKARYEELAKVAIQKLTELENRQKALEDQAHLEGLRATAAGAMRAAGVGASLKDAEASLRLAIGALSESLQFDRKDPDLQRMRVDAGLRLGRLYLSERRFELAENVVDEIRALATGKEIDDFLSDVKHASDDEAKFATAYERAQVELEGEHFLDAASSFQEALNAAHGRAEAEFGLRFSRGAAAAAIGRHEEALAIFAEATPFAQRPVDRGALEHQVARSRDAIADAAIAAAQEALKLSKLDDARKAVERAIAYRPGDSQAATLAAEIKARGNAPDNTVVVRAGLFTFGTGAATREDVKCAGFFIGLTEVTNQEFAAFVNDRGYEKRDLWDPEGWAARADFVGADGAPGPLGWTGGAPPAGKEKFPVAGVSWYEARAFARWKGAGWRLPSDI